MRSDHSWTEAYDELPVNSSSSVWTSAGPAASDANCTAGRIWWAANGTTANVANERNLRTHQAGDTDDGTPATG